ncbi:hypothetical protein ACHAWF_006423 [Thalassiosira exigua]
MERLTKLERDLGSVRGPGLHDPYNGEASVKNLRRFVAEATDIFETYPDFDDGRVAPAFAILAHNRSGAGLPSEPPSQVKVMVWNMVKIARLTLAEAYEAKEKWEEALVEYEFLVDHCFRARAEIWEGECQLHQMMGNLALCLKRSGRFEEAADWYSRADQMCVAEDPDSEIHRSIKRNVAVMLQNKAGAPTFCEDGAPRKGWKRCWSCQAKESEGVKMLRCGRCSEVRHATPAYYCSKKCQADDWPRHKAFHKSVKLRAKQSSGMLKKEDLAGLAANPVVDDGDGTYSGLIRRAAQCTAQNDAKDARRMYEKAIKLEPSNPHAHHNLATIFANSGHVAGAVTEFIETVLLIESGGMMYDSYLEIWARSVVSTHALFRDHGGALVHLNKPKFITNDDLMLKCARQASNIVPSYNECWAMLAGLAERRGEIDESVKFYKKAAKCSENKGNRAKFDREAKRVRKLG